MIGSAGAEWQARFQVGTGWPVRPCGGSAPRLPALTFLEGSREEGVGLYPLCTAPGGSDPGPQSGVKSVDDGRGFAKTTARLLWKRESRRRVSKPSLPGPQRGWDGRGDESRYVTPSVSPRIWRKAPRGWVGRGSDRWWSAAHALASPLQHTSPLTRWHRKEGGWARGTQDKGPSTQPLRDRWAWAP